jgi:hypothetical protein
MSKRATSSLGALAWAAAALAAAGQDTERQVEVDYDKAADFARYRSFAWTPFQTPAQEPAVHIRLSQSIERELLAHGLSKADNAAQADLFVQYEARLDKKVRGRATRTESHWQPSNPRFIVNFDRVEIGTLVITLWDTRRKDVVWHARGSAILGRADERPRQADQAVKQMLSAFPPKPAEAPGP